MPEFLRSLSSSLSDSATSSAVVGDRISLHAKKERKTRREGEKGNRGTREQGKRKKEKRERKEKKRKEKKKTSQKPRRRRVLFFCLCVLVKGGRDRKQTRNTHNTGSAMGCGRCVCAQKKKQPKKKEKKKRKQRGIALFCAQCSVPIAFNPPLNNRAHNQTNSLLLSSPLFSRFSFFSLTHHLFPLSDLALLGDFVVREDCPLSELRVFFFFWGLSGLV